MPRLSAFAVFSASAKELPLYRQGRQAPDVTLVEGAERKSPKSSPRRFRARRKRGAPEGKL